MCSLCARARIAIVDRHLYIVNRQSSIAIRPPMAPCRGLSQLRAPKVNLEKPGRGLRPPPHPFGRSVEHGMCCNLIIFHIFCNVSTLFSVPLIIFRLLVCARLFLFYFFALLFKSFLVIAWNPQFNRFLITSFYFHAFLIFSILVWQLNSWI